MNDRVLGRHKVVRITDHLFAPVRRSSLHQRNCLYGFYKIPIWLAPNEAVS